MRPDRIVMLVVLVGLLLGMSWAARTYLARQRCAEMGYQYVEGKGCVAPPPIIIERGLKRT